MYYINNHPYNTCYNHVVVIIDKKASAFFQRIRGGGRRLNIISLKCELSFPYSFLVLLVSEANVNKCFIVLFATTQRHINSRRRRRHLNQASGPKMRPRLRPNLGTKPRDQTSGPKMRPRLRPNLGTKVGTKPRDQSWDQTSGPKMRPRLRPNLGTKVGTKDETKPRDQR